ncbi:MAG: MarR family transcriptional regulator [Acetobacteraceae bacterium]
MTRLYNEVLAPAGLGLNQYSILAKLERGGEQIIQDLAALLTMDRSTLGHLLRPLQERGLVEIRTSTEDGRKKVVVLTAEGARRLGSAKPLWKTAEARFQAAFGQANAVGMRAMMRQITTVEFEAAAD